MGHILKRPAGLQLSSMAVHSTSSAKCVLMAATLAWPCRKKMPPACFPFLKCLDY